MRRHASISCATTAWSVRTFRKTRRCAPRFLPAPTSAQLLADYKPSEKGAVSEAFVPSQENIDKRTRVLSFGELNVALLPKQNRGNTVNVQTNFQWGSPESLTGRMIEAELAAAMLSRGTDKMTRQQIADEMTRLQMTGGLTGFQTTRENLPDALRLLAHVMRAANFPADEYEQLQRQVATSLQAQLDNPETISRDALATHFNTYPPGDPRHYVPLRTRIDAVAKTPLDAARKLSHRLLRNGARRNRCRRRFRCQADRSAGQRAVHRLPVEGAVRTARSRVSRGQTRAAGDRHARKGKRLYPRAHRLSAA